MNHKIRTALFIISLVSIAASLVVAAESIPLSLKRGIPEIEVIINDSIKASFVIDTGADHIYIDMTFAEKHGLLSGRTQPMRPTRGAQGVSEAKLFNINKLELGDKAFSDLSMVAIDLVSQIKDTSKGYPDGVLGSNFLRNIPLILDYVHHQIRFPDSMKAAASMVVPFKLHQHFIIVNVSINDSVKTKMILDTGSSYTILTPNLAKGLGLSNNGHRKSIVNVGLDNRHSVKDVVFLIRDVPDLKGDLEIGGILGTTFLQKSVLFINWDSKKLWIGY